MAVDPQGGLSRQARILLYVGLLAAVSVLRGRKEGFYRDFLSVQP